MIQNSKYHRIARNSARWTRESLPDCVQDRTPDVGQESRPSRIDVAVVAGPSNIRQLSEEYHLLDRPAGWTLPRNKMDIESLFSILSRGLFVSVARSSRHWAFVKLAINSVNHMALHGLRGQGSKLCCMNTLLCISKIFGKQPKCLSTKTDLALQQRRIPKKKWRRQ